jgi:hypothetical protein
MKTYSIVLMAGLLMAGPGGAKAQDDNAAERRYIAYPDCSNPKKVAQARVNYLWSLGSDNPGVVGSALAQIAYFSLCKPDFCTEEMTAAVASLAATGSTAAVRYRAYLAGLVIENPAMFTLERDARYETGEQLFSALANRLQEKLLSYNDRKYVRAE